MVDGSLFGGLISLRVPDEARVDDDIDDLGGEAILFYISNLSFSLALYHVGIVELVVLAVKTHSLLFVENSKSGLPGA